MYGDKYRNYILELNASNDRGIDTVREKITEFVRSKSDKLRLVILDEVDAMTPDAQAALRKVMEKYSKNSRFCLICNNITRIIPGLGSRCAKMRFGSLQKTEIRHKVDEIVELEQIFIESKSLDALLELNSDFRQVLNTLQCLHCIKLGSVEQVGSPESVGSTEKSKECSIEPTVSIQPAEPVIEPVKYTPITVDEIYSYLSKPKPSEVKAIYKLLKLGFHKSYPKLIGIFRQNQWDLVEMMGYLVTQIISDKDLLEEKRCFILREFSEIESRIIQGRDSELQLAAMIACF